MTWSKKAWSQLGDKENITVVCFRNCYNKCYYSVLFSYSDIKVCFIIFMLPYTATHIFKSIWTVFEILCESIFLQLWTYYKCQLYIFRQYIFHHLLSPSTEQWTPLNAHTILRVYIPRQILKDVPGIHGIKKDSKSK